MMIVLSSLVNAAVYGFIIAAAVKMYIWMKDLAHLAPEQPGFFFYRIVLWGDTPIRRAILFCLVVFRQL